MTIRATIFHVIHTISCRSSSIQIAMDFASASSSCNVHRYKCIKSTYFLRTNFSFKETTLAVYFLWLTDFERYIVLNEFTYPHTYFWVCIPRCVYSNLLNCFVGFMCCHFVLFISFHFVFAFSLVRNQQNYFFPRTDRNGSFTSIFVQLSNFYTNHVRILSIINSYRIEFDKWGTALVLFLLKQHH